MRRYDKLASLLKQANPSPGSLDGVFTPEELGRPSGAGGQAPGSLDGVFTPEELGRSSEKDFEHKVLYEGETLQKGSKDSTTGGLVSKVQTLLERLGYTLPRSGVDGDFGSETESAVLEFQRNHHKERGLAVSGVINGITLLILQSTTAKRRSAAAPAGEAVLTEQEARRQRARGRNAPSVSGSGRVSKGKLYSDLIAGIAYPNLCKAMVANAIAESSLYYNANGDCGNYAKSRKEKSLDTSLYPESFRRPKRGRCCSFGLWQYNICGGLGNRLLGSALNGSDEEKIAILISYEKQVQFMIAHVNRKIAGINSKESKSVDFWVEWFVRKVERPAKMDKAVVKRQQIARGLVV